MTTTIAILSIILGLICWVGQTLSFFMPKLASKIGLNEPDMDPVLYRIETKANGLADVLLTWTLPVSGILLLLDNPYWSVMGLLGGGIYAYFSLLIIFTRYFLSSKSINVGPPKSVKFDYLIGTLWFLIAVAMISISFGDLTHNRSLL